MEFYTELLENGYDLPRLREYFSNPGNFEGSSSATLNKQTSFIRALHHDGDDSISLGGGGNGEFLMRTSSSQTFDSTSIDNITRYSEDIDWTNGTGSGVGGVMTSAGGTGEQRFNDERVAVLEFELRKARDTIQALRQTLTYDSAEEQQQQQHKKTSQERHSKSQGESQRDLLRVINDPCHTNRSFPFVDLDAGHHSIGTHRSAIRTSDVELSRQ